MSVALPNRWSLKSFLPWAALALCLVLLAASFVLHDVLFHGRSLLASPAHSEATAAPIRRPRPAQPGTVTLAEGKWKVAGIRIEPANQILLPSEVGVAGKIEANPDRRVEIRPRAAGVVREVPVVLGRKVKKGELLAVLDSPDVGTARLNLRGRQIELVTARNEVDWKKQVADNVAELIPALRKGDRPPRFRRNSPTGRSGPTARSCSRPTPSSRSPRTRTRRPAPCSRIRSSASTRRSSPCTPARGARPSSRRCSSRSGSTPRSEQTAGRPAGPAWPRPPSSTRPSGSGSSGSPRTSPSCSRMPATWRPPDPRRPKT